MIVSKHTPTPFRKGRLPHNIIYPNWLQVILRIFAIGGYIEGEAAASHIFHLLVVIADNHNGYYRFQVGKQAC